MIKRTLLDSLLASSAYIHTNDVVQTKLNMVGYKTANRKYNNGKTVNYNIQFRHTIIKIAQAHTRLILKTLRFYNLILTLEV